MRTRHAGAARPAPCSMAAFLVGGLSMMACDGGQAVPEPMEVVRATAPSSTAPRAPQGRGRPAELPDSELVEKARTALSGAGSTVRRHECGPYQALSTAPDGYVEICQVLGEHLDAVYQARFGVPVAHPPAGLVLLFDSGEAFRDFAGEVSAPSTGYAGFTIASRGVVAVLANPVAEDRFAQTLGHELAHLAHRRTFGFNLRPWLSEGLADALGDTATPGGFEQLAGIEGVEPLAERLQLALTSGRLDSVAKVTRKDRASFDRETVSYDYESSALLVRFLLLDPVLSSRFNNALRKLAAAEGCDTHCIFEALAISESELDRRFRAWLDGQS